MKTACIWFAMFVLFFKQLKVMKKYLLLLCGMLFLLHTIHAQQTNYKVVFDLSSKDSVNQQSVVREIYLIKEGNPDAQLEVVVYGQGLNFVLKDKSPQADAIRKITAMKGISVNVCAITMKRMNATKADLIEGVGVVPDGIYEIISRQRDGFGYIKVAH